MQRLRKRARCIVVGHVYVFTFMWERFPHSPHRLSSFMQGVEGRIWWIGGGLIQRTFDSKGCKHLLSKSAKFHGCVLSPIKGDDTGAVGGGSGFGGMTLPRLILGAEERAGVLLRAGRRSFSREIRELWSQLQRKRRSDCSGPVRE